MLANRFDPDTGFEHVEVHTIPRPQRMDRQITGELSAMPVWSEFDSLGNVTIGDT